MINGNLFVGGLHALLAAPYRLVTQRSTNDLTYEAKVCAKVSNAAYTKPEDRKKDNWKKITVDWQGESGTLELDASINETDWCVYIDREREWMILGFKGTNPSTFRDLSADAKLVVTGHSLTMHTHLESQILPKYQDWTLMVTGHSLGGHYACNILLGKLPDGSQYTTDLFMYVRAVHIFNSAPISCFPYARGSDDPTEFSHHHIFGDPVSCTTGGLLGCEMGGKWTTVTYTPNQLDLHGLANFLQ